MKPGAVLLLLVALPALVATNDNEVVSDPLAQDPALEIIHYFLDRWPGSIAVSQNNRYFCSFPGALDGRNVYNSSNDNFQLGELTDQFTEVPYPNAAMNQPPGGPIDYTQSPPVGKAFSNYFIGVQGLHVTPDDLLYVVDCGRSIDASGAQVLASPGGPKIVVISIANDTVIATYILPPNIAGPTSLVAEVTVDTINGFIYVTDSSPEGVNAIIVISIYSGSIRRVLQYDKSVEAVYGILPWCYGDPLYQTQFDAFGNPIRASFLTYGVSGVDLAPGGNTLCWKRVGGRSLYCVPTFVLRDFNTSDSEISFYVRDYGETGISVGCVFDSNYAFYCGHMEQDGVFQFTFGNELATLIIRDRRMNVAYSVTISDDGYLYVIVNQLNYLRGIYPGQKSLDQDRRVPPYILIRKQLPNNATKALH